MEGGDNPNPSTPVKDAAEASADGVEDSPLNSQESDNDSDSDDDDAPPAADERDAAADEADLRMSVNNVTSVMRQVLPAQVKIADDVKHSMQNSLNDFISYVTAEANQRRRSERRKTLTPQDLILAFDNVGLREYVEPLSAFFRRHRELEGTGRRNPLPAVQTAWPFAAAQLNPIMYPPPGPPANIMMAPPGGAPSGYRNDGASSSGGAAFGYRDEGGSTYYGGAGDAGGIPLPAIDPSQPVSAAQLGTVVYPPPGPPMNTIMAPPCGAPSGYCDDGASSSGGAAFGYCHEGGSTYCGGAGDADGATAPPTYNLDWYAWGQFFGNYPFHPPN